MGTCYKVIIIDEFDWEYQSYSRYKFIHLLLEKAKEIGVYCKLLSECSNIVIIDIHKHWPLGEEIQNLLSNLAIDLLYYQTDENISLIKFNFEKKHV